MSIEKSASIPALQTAILQAKQLAGAAHPATYRKLAEALDLAEREGASMTSSGGPIVGAVSGNRKIPQVAVGSPKAEQAVEEKRLTDERLAYFEAAKKLRGAIRVALDEWHKFTDHLDDSIAVHDVLEIAYQDTAGTVY